jgi:signal transduction histidine kinase/CheY-like chemotaxis protein
MDDKIVCLVEDNGAKRRAVMSQALRVLIVEDSENDALLLVRELRRGGFEPEFRRVDTAEAMDAALTEGTWDLVLSDYSMPHFSGIAALELVKKCGLDLPFIVVSGTIGEDMAVAAMKAGAHDYMMKGNLRRLVSAIDRELREAKVRCQRWQAEAELKRNLERIKVLHEINVAAVSTLDLQAVLQILLEKIDIVFPAFATTVRLFNQQTGELEPVACRNVNEKEWKAISQDGLKGLAKVVLENKIPITVSNVQTDPRSAISHLAVKEGLISFLGVPLIAKEEVLGLISFYAKEKYSFSDREIEFLTTLAGQAAVAIHNAQLFEQATVSRKALATTNEYLDRSLRQLSGLYAAMAPVAPAASTREMTGVIIERLLDATGAEAALIGVWESGSLPVVDHRGFSEDYIDRVKTSPAGGGVQWVIQHCEPILAPDIAFEPRLEGKVHLQLGWRSCAILPLKIQGEVRGIMHIASRKTGYFDAEHKNHLMAIARQMSIALENRELFESLKASKDQLERANKVKDEFLGVMSHELRTPLNVIMGYTGLLHGAMLGEINPTQVDATAKIMAQCKDLLVMVNSILQATLLGSGATKVFRNRCNLSDLLDELKSSYAIPQPKELTITWDYPANLSEVRTDKEKLKHILQNLINNAIKFTPRGHVTVSGRVIKGGMPEVPESTRQINNGGIKRWLEFKVSDTGVGIPREHLPVIFEMFRQVDSSETRPYGGIGLGLFIVKKYVELLGGKVKVESEPGKGSTFVVLIPYGLDSDEAKEVTLQ